MLLGSRASLWFRKNLSPVDIKRIVQVYGSSQNLLDLKFVTMCLLGYAGFLRFDELVNIRRNDILFEDKQINLFIQKSKTDQLKHGSWLVIAKRERTPVQSSFSLCICQYLVFHKILANLSSGNYHSIKNQIHMF